ncbi:Mss4-like protein, partial [Cytidiella melzeri]
DSPSRRTGSCLCGQISYEITGEPLFSALCHCVNCKKWSGTSFVWYAFVKSDHIRVAKGENLLKTYKDSATIRGNTVHRQFCSNCGCSLMVTFPKSPEMLGVPLGGLDEDVSKIWKPTEEVFCKGRLKWLPDMGCRCSETVPELDL